MKEIQEAVCCMAVMPAIWKQTELPVEKDHGISRLEEVFSGSCTASSSGEVVDKSDSLLF